MCGEGHVYIMINLGGKTVESKFDSTLKLCKCSDLSFAKKYKFSMHVEIAKLILNARYMGPRNCGLVMERCCKDRPTVDCN
jgi:hypothetical protein